MKVAIVGPEVEFVEDGVTGFVVAPDDPEAVRRRLRQLLADLRMAERMGAAARELVQADFTWERTAERCLKAYTDGGRG